MKLAIVALLVLCITAFRSHHHEATKTNHLSTVLGKSHSKESAFGRAFTKVNFKESARALAQARGDDEDPKEEAWDLGFELDEAQEGFLNGTVAFFYTDTDKDWRVTYDEFEKAALEEDPTLTKEELDYAFYKFHFDWDWEALNLEEFLSVLTLDEEE